MNATDLIWTLHSLGFAGRTGAVEARHAGIITDDELNAIMCRWFMVSMEVIRYPGN